MGKLPRSENYKIDICRLVQERASSDPTTSLKKIEVKEMRLEMNELQMTPDEVIPKTKKLLKKIKGKF